MVNRHEWRGCDYLLLVVSSLRPRLPQFATWEVVIQHSELAGLSVLTVNVDEVMSPGALDTDGVDMIRLMSPDPSTWSALRARGFLPKPDWLTWVANCGEDDAAFLSRIGSRERAGIRQAFSWIENTHGTVGTEPMSEDLLAEFLLLYDSQLDRMPRGVPVAHKHRADLLSRCSDMQLICIRVDGDLIGGCVIEYKSGSDLARMRFSAVSAPGRLHGLSRALYVRAVSHAREMGAKRVTLGNDPNLYGHLVQPGLFDFKRRLGFTPIPSRAVDPTNGEEVADRIVSLTNLHDPTLMVGFADDESVLGGGYPRLTLDYFTNGSPTALPRHMPSNIEVMRVHCLSGEFPG